MPRLTSNPNLAHLRSLAGIPSAFGFDQLRQVPVGRASSPHDNVQLAPFRNAWWFNVDSTLCQCSHTSLNKKAVAWIRLEPNTSLYGTLTGGDLFLDLPPVDEVQKNLQYKAVHVSGTKPDGPIGQYMTFDTLHTFSVTAHNPHQTVRSEMRIGLYVPDRLNHPMLIGTKMIHFYAYYDYEPGGGNRPNL